MARFPPTGAAVRDMLEILLRRWPGLEVWVRPVAVQGDGAAAQIAAAIAELAGPDQTLPSTICLLVYSFCQSSHELHRLRSSFF